MLGPTYLYGVIYSALSLEATFFSGELYSQTVYENVNGFVSVHSLASDQQALRFLPTPTPLAFLRGGGACTLRLIIFIHAPDDLRDNKEGL